MWIFLTILYSFLFAVTNYTDELLAHKNSVEIKKGIFHQIGGVVLFSTLMGIVSCVVLLMLGKVTWSGDYRNIAIAFFSAVPMVVMWIGYFYFLVLYPANKAVPLFGLTTVWIFAIEIFFGATVSLIGLICIIVLIVGAYLVDSATFKLKVPSFLFFGMVIMTMLWSLSLLMMKQAVNYIGDGNAFFWQFACVFILGLCMFVGVRQFRSGFVERIKQQGSFFIGLSMFNEISAQVTFYLTMLAIAAAPLAAYSTALASIQVLFVVIIMWLFPISERSRLNNIQILGICCIVLGVGLIQIL